jgi:hypothetical protein
VGRLRCVLIAFEDAAEIGEFLFDFLVGFGVFGDDEAEVTSEHAFGGDEDVEGVGWGIEAELPDEFLVRENGRIVEDGAQDAVLEDSPNVETTAAGDFDVHVKESACDDGLAPDEFHAIGMAIDVDWGIGGADILKREHIARGGAFDGAAAAERTEDEVIECLKDEGSETAALAVSIAE